MDIVTVTGPDGHQQRLTGQAAALVGWITLRADEINHLESARLTFNIGQGIVKPSIDRHYSALRVAKT